MSDSEFKIEFENNADLVREELEAAMLRALEKCGLVAEGYAKKAARVDTGLLRNSITHAIGGQEAAISEYRDIPNKKSGKYSGKAPNDSSNQMSVYIGTNVEYAEYIEVGTGRHTKGGRPTPWAYKGEDGAWHKTKGQLPDPFLKPAVRDHVQTYRNIIEDELKHG